MLIVFVCWLSFVAVSWCVLLWSFGCVVCCSSSLFVARCVVLLCVARCWCFWVGACCMLLLVVVVCC